MKCKFERHGPVGDGNSVCTARIVGKFLFKAASLFPCPIIDRAGTQDADCSLNFVGFKVWPWCERSRADCLPTDWNQSTGGRVCVRRYRTG